MDNSNCSTEHKKYQHLSSEERHIIEVRFNEDKWTIYAIAKSLGRPYNTIKNEINRGTVYLYNGKIARYKADKGEEAYREHRKNSCRNYRCLETAKFLRYVEDQFFDEGWSLDAAVGHAKANGLFSSKEMVCTKTLYNYVDSGLLKIKNIDLPEKLSRKTKTKKDRENKRKLGNSIEQRPDIVDTREEFGHWEIDSVIGRKAEGESQVMTIVERKLRKSIWIKVRDHSAEAIDEALSALIDQFGDKYNEVFKSITGDNGSEFANLSQIESKGIAVYFTHPYSSYEKGTNECHNKMLRRFIPKGKSIDDYSADDILYFADKINNLPRKILGYRTPEELFEQELDRIYVAA